MGNGPLVSCVAIFISFTLLLTWNYNTKQEQNSQISIETSAPQQAGGFIKKYYFGITAYR